MCVVGCLCEQVQVEAECAFESDICCTVARFSLYFSKIFVRLCFAASGFSGSRGGCAPARVDRPRETSPRARVAGVAHLQ